MRLKNIHIKNLRSIQDQRIDIDDYTAFVGMNGAGKSTVLYALNIFFKEPGPNGESVGELNEEDFFRGDTSKPIEVSLTFTELSDKAQEDLKHYVQDEQLVVSAYAEYDSDKKTAKVVQRGLKRAIPEFVEFRDVATSGKPASEAMAIYQRLRSQFPGLPVCTQRPRASEALDEYEANHPNKLALTPSEDQFYGIAGSGRLAPYIQWVYVPAVKDAASEKSGTRNTAIEKLVLRALQNRSKIKDAVEKVKTDAQAAYSKVLDDNVSELADLSTQLTSRLQLFSHPDIALDLKWSGGAKEMIRVSDPVADVYVKEFEAMSHAVSRCGHGVQRSYIMALLQELAQSEDDDAPTLLLGIEEPELYQHPPQARHLAGVLHELCEKGDQIIVTTHSPYFVSADSFENVRHASRDSESKATQFVQASFQGVIDRLKDAGCTKPNKPAGLMAKLQPELVGGLNEMFFSKTLVFVEGPEDEAYLRSHAVLHGFWNDFRRLGISIIPTNKKSNMPRPLAIALELGIKAFAIFDCDGDESHAGNREKHKHDNLILMNLLDVNEPSGFVASDLLNDNCYIASNILYDSFGSEFGETDLKDAWAYASSLCGSAGGLEKNPLLIGHLVSKLADQGMKSTTLENICVKIITFAEN